MTDISIHKITVGKWFENTYLLEKNNNVLIIDPGDDFTVINRFIIEHKLKPIAVINTHGHFDHLGAVKQLKDEYQIEFYIHSKDKRLVSQANLYRKLAGDNTLIPTPKIDHFMDAMEHFKLDGFDLQIIQVPGHTEGSVAFSIDNNLFSGDLLFENSTGRTDLPGGDAAVIKDTIKMVLQRFMGFTLHPGHGASFIIDGDYMERLKNIF